MRRDTALDPRFPAGAHEALRSLRKNHFWFCHRREVILRFAADCLAGGSRPRVLDFGCGDGYLLETLAERWWAAGLERRISDLLLARRSAARVVVAEGSAPPFSRSFDLVGLFDVVEHVEDDAGLLSRAAGLAQPGGWVLLTVPADPRLWSSLDDYAGHFRRYTRRGVLELFQRAGLEARTVVPLFRVLWPLARLKALFDGRRPVDDPEGAYAFPAIVNATFAALLSVERALAGDSGRGIGTSWLASARVPAEPART